LNGHADMFLSDFERKVTSNDQQQLSATERLRLSSFL